MCSEGNGSIWELIVTEQKATRVAEMVGIGPKPKDSHVSDRKDTE